MEINLRKATAIQSEIKNAISAIEVRDRVTLNEFMPDPIGEIEKARAEFNSTVTRKISLTVALYELRNLVSVANAKAGVGVILGNIERNNAAIRLVDGYLSSSERNRALSNDEILKRLEKIRNAPAETVRYGSSDVTSSVLDSEAHDAIKVKVRLLRKEVQELQDKLLTINVTTNVTLSEDLVSVLREEGIL